MNTEPKPKKEPIVHNATQRVTAVLSVWTERRRPSEICQELGINTGLLGQWQDRALEAMLRALEPRSRPQPQRGPALTPKLERLLARQEQAQQGTLTRLDRRLAKLQEGKPAPKPAS